MREDIVRNATKTEIIGTWERVSEPPGLCYFVIREDFKFGWISCSTKIENASGSLLSKVIDSPEPGNEVMSKWNSFAFPDGTMTICRHGTGEPYRHWFSTAVSSGIKLAYPAAIDLRRGDIVWAEILPDPNQHREKPPQAMSSPADPDSPPKISPPATIGFPQRVAFPPEYKPFLDTPSPDTEPSRPRPPAGWNDPVFEPPRLISPQPLRQYLLKRLPEL